jgi:SHOCT-like domain
MSEAFEQVLQLVAQGKLSAEEAAPILEALEQKPKGVPGAPGAPAAPTPPTPPQLSADLGPAVNTGQPPRFARIEVRERGRRVVDLRIPISLGRFALSRVPGLSTQQIAEVEDAVTSGAHGPILDVQDPDGDGVRIVLE